MILEASIVVNYLQSHLYSKLPRRRVDCYGEELEKHLHKKIQSHWYPDDPQREANNRCIHTNGPRVDQCLIDASVASGLDWNEIRLCLPPSLKISIDPGHVSVQYASSPNGSMNDSGYFGSNSKSGNVWQAGSCCASSSTSSGCSSASSESSSNNGGSTTPQTMKQVLYSDGYIDFKKIGDVSLKGDINSGVTSVKPWNNNTDCENIEKVKDLFVSDEQVKNLLDKSKKAPCILQSDDGFSDGRNFLFSNSTSPWTANTTDSMGYNSMPSNDRIQANIINNNPVKPVQMCPNPESNKNTTMSRFLLLANNNGAELPIGDIPCSLKSAAQQQMNFTAAMFAQTKFGSTKLKTHSKRNKKILSPNEAHLPNGLTSEELSFVQNVYQRSNDQSSGRQEMLREAIQQQQQLLNAVDSQNYNGGIWPTPIGSHRKVNYSPPNFMTPNIDVQSGQPESLFNRYTNQHANFPDLNDAYTKHFETMGSSNIRSDAVSRGHLINNVELCESSNMLNDEANFTEQFENIFSLESNDESNIGSQNIMPMYNQTYFKQNNIDWPPLSASNPWSSDFTAKCSSSMDQRFNENVRKPNDLNSTPTTSDNCVMNLNNSSVSTNDSKQIKQTIENDICSLLNISAASDSASTRQKTPKQTTPIE